MHWNWNHGHRWGVYLRLWLLGDRDLQRHGRHWRLLWSAFAHLFLRVCLPAFTSNACSRVCVGFRRFLLDCVYDGQHQGTSRRRLCYNPSLTL